MSPVLEPSTIDGRWLRSIRTRSAIIDAWLTLIEEGDLSPTAKGVADRAGIGLRTVFQHFSDMNALHVAAGEELLSRIIPRVAHVAAELPLTERIEATVESRSAVFEEITGLRQASERQEWLSDEIRDLIDQWEAIGTASTQRIFAAELARADDAVREQLTAAVDSLISWSYWNQLRLRRGLGIDESRAVIRFALATMLDAAA